MKCCPDLVYGAGDETLYVLPASKDLWERVTEGWRSLDGWEADLSWMDKKKNINTLQNYDMINYQHTELEAVSLY